MWAHGEPAKIANIDTDPEIVNSVEQRRTRQLLDVTAGNHQTRRMLTRDVQFTQSLPVCGVRHALENSLTLSRPSVWHMQVKVFHAAQARLVDWCPLSAVWSHPYYQPVNRFQSERSVDV